MTIDMGKDFWDLQDNDWSYNFIERPVHDLKVTEMRTFPAHAHSLCPYTIHWQRPAHAQGKGAPSLSHCYGAESFFLSYTCRPLTMCASRRERRFSVPVRVTAMTCQPVTRLWTENERLTLARRYSAVRTVFMTWPRWRRSFPLSGWTASALVHRTEAIAFTSD